MASLLINNQLVEAKAMLFDKDGTLVEFHELWVGTTKNRIEELSKQLAKHKMLPLAQDEKRDLAALLGVPNGHLGIGHGRVDSYGPLIMSGPTDHETLAAGFVYQRRGGAFNEIIRFTQDAFKVALREQDPRLLNGTTELLMTLRKRGWLLGIVTNDGEEQTLEVLTQMGVKDLFHTVVCAHEQTVNGTTKRIRKPDTEMVATFCREVRVNANETIVVADSHNDLNMGTAAHCAAVIGVRSGVDSDDLLMKASPDCIVDSVADLLGMILNFRHADTKAELGEINNFYANPDLHYNGKATAVDEVIVAEIGGQLAGCVRLCEEEGLRVLRGMCIHPKYQRRGIGRQMLSAVASALKGQSCWCVPYKHLMSFYEKAGFRVEGLNPNAAELDSTPSFLRHRLREYKNQGLDVCIMHRVPSD